MLRGPSCWGLICILLLRRGRDDWEGGFKGGGRVG